MFVYRIRNKINNKSYVGQTARTVQERVFEHFKYHLNRGCKKLSFAIKKYGVENFEYETIDCASTIQELNEKEVYWIKFYDAVENGYNLSPGGDNKLVTKETREKLSKAGKNRKLSKETLQKLIKINSIKVYQYNLDGDFIKEFNSITEAAVSLKIDGSEIVKVCKGKRRQCSGFQWRYIELVNIGPILPKKLMPKRGEGNSANAKKVAKIDISGKILETYKTAKQAAIKNECDHSSVCKVCNGKLKSIKGHLFIFI